MINSSVLSVNDLDPLQRHKKIGSSQKNKVQVCVIALNDEVANALNKEGITYSNLNDSQSLSIMHPKELAKTLYKLGANEKLGLSGRPKRRLRAMATSRLYNINKRNALFLPQSQSHQEFYLEIDNRILIEEIKTEYSYICRHWTDNGQPVQALLITPAMIDESDSKFLYDFLRQIQMAQVATAKSISIDEVLSITPSKNIFRVPDLPNNCPTLGTGLKVTSHLKFSQEETTELTSNVMDRLNPDLNEDQLLAELIQSQNLYRQAQILNLLCKRHSLEYSCYLGIAHEVSVADLLEEVYERACELRIWSIIRSISGLLNKSHYGLDDAVTELLVRQKRIIVGRSYSSEGIILQSDSGNDIAKRIKKCCGDDKREELIHQEILLFLSYFVKQDPKLFKAMISIRTSEFIHLIVAQIASEMDISMGKAFDLLVSMSPFAIQSRLKAVLSDYKNMKQNMLSLESINCSSDGCEIQYVSMDGEYETRIADWAKWRLQNGAIMQPGKNFYPRLREVLKSCKGIVLGDKFNSSNCIDSSLALSSMTSGEPAFAMLAENLLNEIPAADYRHLCAEALSALGAFASGNPTLKINDFLVMDVIIGHAVRINWIKAFPAQEQNYHERKAHAWELIYKSSPQRVANAVIDAFEFLTNNS
jgi:phosphorylase kinase alpha/beta subunit